MGLKHRMTGWMASDFDIYENLFMKYGGSINTHPDVVRFFMSHRPARYQFWHRCVEGEITAAWFTVEGNTPGLCVWRDYPVSWDEVRFPFAPGQRFVLPIRTNRLSPWHRHQVMNAFFSERQSRRMCFIKQAFSGSTIKKRKGELRRFMEAGGEIVKLSEMSASDIARMYVRLFRLRFNHSVRCYEQQNIAQLLSAVPHMVAGNALFFRGQPCALDLVLCGRSEKMAYFDVPNGGLDPQFLSFSPGSVLMWANICDARSQCLSEQREMIFSVGVYDKDWEYKLRWAEPEATGRVISL